MSLSLFEKNDRVLLLGEGNFSFSVDLMKHNLSLSIISTCYEPNIVYQKQKENIDIITSLGGLVLQGVDATKVHDHPELKNLQFNKIVFNFPHPGGKMKINLCRKLLKGIFLSVKEILEKNGKVLITLCQGQGGSMFEKIHRFSHDTWQIEDLADQAGFELIDVQPFDDINFPSYKSIGYRSQDKKFNTKGGLVHIFEKNEQISMHLNRLNCIFPIHNETVFVPYLYGKLYNHILKQPILIKFIEDSLVKELPETIKILTDNDIPLALKLKCGVSCTDKEGQMLTLRRCIFDILPFCLEKISCVSDVILFPASFFRETSNFSQSVLFYQLIVLGCKTKPFIIQFLNTLKNLFNVEISQNDYQLSYKKFNIENKTELFLSSKNQRSIVCKSYDLIYLNNNIEVNIIYVESLCKFIFELSDWRQVWAQHVDIPVNLKINYPILETFNFDMSIKMCEDLQYDLFKEIMLLTAGENILSVTLINSHCQNEWKTDTYRITYCPFDKALCRRKALEIHYSVAKYLSDQLNIFIT